MRLSGLNVLVTGGTAGIGKRLVEQLDWKRANVAFCGLEPERIAKIESYTSAKGVQADLLTEEGIHTCFTFAMETLGSIDILINNAGYAIAKPIEDLTRADFEEMFAMNVIAPARLVQKVLPHFKQQGFGNIVNVGATGGQYGFQTGSAYGSSKAALRNLSQCLVQELRSHNIRVIHINPSRRADTLSMPEDEEVRGRLRASSVAEAIISSLELIHSALITELNIWTTNPKT